MAKKHPIVIANSPINLFLIFFERLKIQTIVRFMNDDYNILDVLKILFIFLLLTLIYKLICYINFKFSQKKFYNC